MKDGIMKKVSELLDMAGLPEESVKAVTEKLANVKKEKEDDAKEEKVEESIDEAAERILAEHFEEESIDEAAERILAEREALSLEESLGVLFEMVQTIKEEYEALKENYEALISEEEVSEEKVDKRDIIRQIMAIAGKNEGNEDVRTIAKLAEKLAYEGSETSKVDEAEEEPEVEEVSVADLNLQAAPEVKEEAPVQESLEDTVEKITESIVEIQEEAIVEEVKPARKAQKAFSVFAPISEAKEEVKVEKKARKAYTQFPNL